MANKQTLIDAINDRFNSQIETVVPGADMVTVELLPTHLLEICTALHDAPPFNFELLLDVCGVDYLEYGVSPWRTEKTTNTGFSRGFEEVAQEQIIPWNKPRFAVVYHLLSLRHNHRIRLKTYVEGDPPLVPSVIKIWSSADWYEREAFDLYGIVFEGHPDLRRLLTDYGFVGYPFRKDFPLIGEVELRYDAAQQRCVYEPVSIQPRVLVPKVIRVDGRYEKGEKENG
ncbi:NADH-quinone oxidoreductase subunit C [Coxiella endosymbiont of Ornithodoros maritimus]|uniref:NADH-quinone oxidoreductase subunit C n=1 Tax=Coxiella endosymbiont of Ornithodoros maritimus TaxID=1656172 RepID=UPI0022653D69|nr:NADH-quinone oxidoreductase subunit C [Coxiella endosymbiont of Ornithodoros maritimus]